MGGGNSPIGAVGSRHGHRERGLMGTFGATTIRVPRARLTTPEGIRNGAAASVVLHHVGPQAPIVMGRSVSLHHKTKLHHVRVKPLDSNENSTSADGSQ